MVSLFLLEKCTLAFEYARPAFLTKIVACKLDCEQEEVHQWSASCLADSLCT